MTNKQAWIIGGCLLAGLLCVSFALFSLSNRYQRYQIVGGPGAVTMVDTKTGRAWYRDTEENLEFPPLHQTETHRPAP